MRDQPRRPSLETPVLPSFVAVIGRARTSALRWALLLLLVSGTAARAQAADAPADPGAFLDHYFAVWSAGDLRAYADTFHADAVVREIGADGDPVTMSLPRFIRSQEAAHARTPGMREYALDTEIHRERPGFVRALVRYELLMPDGDTVRGWDHFHLIRVGGAWRILSLVYEPDR